MFDMRWAAHRQDLYQGPGPPWCIGSVFSTPQLLTGAEIEPMGPLLFDRAGEPREFVSTGCKLQLFDDPLVNVAAQADYLYKDESAPYCPTDIVGDLLQEDVALKLAMIHDSNQTFGNRLECVKCRDGKMQLFFPMGQNVNSVASVLCKRDNAGHWCPLKKENDECDSALFNGVRLSVSPSLSHPILQLSALAKDKSNVDEVLLVARTAYQVHITNIQREDDRVCFSSSSVTSYRKGLSHVTWNPHFEGELASIFETGEVCVYDVQSDKECTTNLRAKFTVNGASQRVFGPAGYSKGSDYLPEPIRLQYDKLRESWWRCEYGWHPRTLLIANAEEVFLFDLRTKIRASQQQTTQLASVQTTKRYCRQRHFVGDRFVALVRSDHDGMYHFATASKQHVLLFDVRKPRIPLLQWEHKMQQDSPGFLSIIPLSKLRPAEEYSAASAGRAIIAANYRSGDIRIFSYGPQAPMAAIVSGASSRFRDLEDAYNAWQIPAKIFSANADNDCWTDILRCSASLLKAHQTTDDVFDLRCAESISGLALLPDRNPITGRTNPKGFSLMQLTGSGEILSQSYNASRSLDNGAPKTVRANKMPIRVMAKGKTVLKYQPLSALCNYVGHGFVWPQDSSKDTGENANGFQHKRQKTFNSERITKFQELIYEVLGDTDIPICVHELAFKVLRMSLPEVLASLAAEMPSNVTGYSKNSSRWPYILPPLKILAMDETPVPLPLPFVLEIEPQVTSNVAKRITEFRDEKNKSGHSYFTDACELVEEVTSNIRRKQEEPVISLDSEDDSMKLLTRSLHFHSNSNAAASGSSCSGFPKRAQAASRDFRFRNFVGSQPLSNGGSQALTSFWGHPLVDLRFNSAGDLEPPELKALTSLQEDFEKWQQNFAPYNSYCNSRC